MLTDPAGLSVWQVGSPPSDIFVKELKEKPAEAFAKLELDPGEAIQENWRPA